MDYQKSSLTILVLDGETRSCLAVVRDLGKAGYRVIVAHSTHRAIASGSKFCSQSLLLPDPKKRPAEYIKGLKGILKQHKPNILLPISDLSLQLVLEEEIEIRTLVTLPTIDAATFRTISGKAQLLEQAHKLGIKVPASVTITSKDNSATRLSLLTQQIKYPAILKPSRSTFHSKGSFHSAPTQYVYSAKEAIDCITNMATQFPDTLELLLQERIQGCGVGVFALCYKGSPHYLFAHQRLLEKPPKGGRSVLSQSIPIDLAPIQEAKKLLTHYQWNGVAMVEFKKDAHGNHYLMEINPRFWGSLQLAINAGRHYPTQLVRLFLNEREKELLNTQEPPYQTDTQLRWLLGTVDHALIRLKQEGLRAFWDMITADSLFVFSTRQKTDVLRLSDLRPFIYECLNYTRTILYRGKTEK